MQAMTTYLSLQARWHLEASALTKCFSGVRSTADMGLMYDLIVDIQLVVAICQKKTIPKSGMIKMRLSGKWKYVEC